MADPTSAGSVLPFANPELIADNYFEMSPFFARYTFFFPHNGTTLLPEHMLKLQDFGELIEGGSMYYEMYALADRSGSREVNLQVGKKRYNAIQGGLYDLGYNMDPSNFGTQEKILGEDFWEYCARQGDGAVYSDGKRNAFFRVVVAYVWEDYASSRTLHAEIPLLKYARSVEQPDV